MRKGNTPRRTYRSDADNDPDFNAFVSSISVSPEVLAALTRMPACSILEVKDHLRHGNGSRQAKSHTAKTRTEAQSRATLR